jgi:hypothetical protein
MSGSELTGLLRNALLADPALAERVRGELRCAIGGLDLSSEERHVARGEGGYALRVLCEEVSGLTALERPGAGEERPSVPAVLLAGALESVDFEAIADELIVEIEEGVPA